MSFEQLIQLSDWIGVVQTESTHSAWDTEHRRIYTTYEFSTKTTLAGEELRRIVIRQPGGTVGRLAQVAYGFPQFTPGEKVLIFIHRRDGGFQVVGLSQGVFEFEPNQESEFVVQRLEQTVFPNDSGIALRLSIHQAIELIHQTWIKKGSAR